VVVALGARRDWDGGVEAGVNVTLRVGEGLPHVCQLMLGIHEAAEATDRIGTFLRARVH
jgi:monoterpene epsilon-lactone hydrolase